MDINIFFIIGHDFFIPEGRSRNDVIRRLDKHVVKGKRAFERDVGRRVQKVSHFKVMRGGIPENVLTFRKRKEYFFPCEGFHRFIQGIAFPYPEELPEVLGCEELPPGFFQQEDNIQFAHRYTILYKSIQDGVLFVKRAVLPFFYMTK